ncbi:glycosyltransferase family 4 protein, partial [candidate division WOR-3 bacterium]|nr:glycosyltransferase family 4 protein [candidate division WOR-3 bacterium]
PRTHVLEFSRALRRHARAVVANPTPPDGLAADGFEYLQCCPPIPRPARLRIISAALRTAARLRRLHRGNPLDILYVREDITAVPALAWARLARVPTALEVNGAIREEVMLVNPRPAGARGLAWQIRLAVQVALLRVGYRLAGRVVVVTPGLRDYLVARYRVRPEKVGVFGNGANTGLFVPLDATDCKRDLGLEPSARYIGFQGNLAPWQGVDDLVHAFARLAPGHPDIRLLVVGDGAEAAKLKDLAQSLGVAGLVRFTGRVPYEQVARCIGACDICAAPIARIARNRLTGTSALKLSEYLACGRPVVASRLDDTRYIAEHDVGRLFGGGDRADLAARLDELLGLAPAELSAMGRRARELGVERFSWNATVAGIVRFVSGDEQ